MVILLVLERVQREYRRVLLGGRGFEGGFTVLKHLDGTKHGQANTRQGRTDLYYSLRGVPAKPNMRMYVSRSFFCYSEWRQNSNA